MNTISTILSFVAVLAMIPVALWLLKRTPAGGGSANSVMRTIAVLPVAPNQRLLTVEVGSGEGRRWLVLGVTPQQITTLYSLPPYAEMQSEEQPTTPSFAQLLGRLRK